MYSKLTITFLESQYIHIYIYIYIYIYISQSKNPLLIESVERYFDNKKLCVNHNINYISPYIYIGS